jgi:GTP-binding protein HflX
VVHKPIINALNKIDRFAHQGDLDEYLESLPELLDEFRNSVPLSALTGRGVAALLDRVEEELESQMVPLTVSIPYNRGDLVDLFHKRGLIQQETHEGKGTLIQGRIPACFVPMFEGL